MFRRQKQPPLPLTVFTGVTERGHHRFERTTRVDEETEIDARQWDYFLNMAQTNMRMNKQSLSPLVEIAAQWGIRKVNYYQWASMGQKYCNMLNLAASRNPVWEEAVIKMNQLLLGRLSERRCLKGSPNPLHLLDLQHLAAWTSQSSFSRRGRKICVLRYEAVKARDVPPGYIFDLYGLITIAETPQSTTVCSDSDVSGGVLCGNKERLGELETQQCETLVLSFYFLRGFILACSISIIAAFYVRPLG